jgi:uncharacterized surface protein with fasciclin (FAS1) repeats
LCALLGLSSAWTVTSCIDDSIPQDAYYTFTGEMVTDYLQNDTAQRFTEFVDVLQRAELWDLLSTYGTFTCFAPTNDAINDYLAKRDKASVDDLTDAECDTLAWMHLLKVAYFTTDLGDGSLPTTNMNNRYLTLTCDTVAGEVKYHINSSEMIVRDDSVENGVMHVVNQVITSSSVLLGELVCNDPNLTIFGSALRLTGLADTIDSRIEDEDYVIDPDSTVADKKHTKYFGNHNVYYRFPAKREFKYSIFAEPDSIYRRYGINSLDDLKRHAKEVYDRTYPQDAGLYDNDWSNRKNPLNRWVAYHILDRWSSYSELTVSEAGFDGSVRSQFLTDKQDIMEFYETMAPYTILKVSDAVGQKYVNRNGVGQKVSSDQVGARILTPSESNALYSDYSDSRNGVYYYVDRLVQYDLDVTIGKILNTRMRIDATTLSPDFMNAGARNIIRNSDDKSKGAEYLMMGFKPGFTKNFIFGEDTFYGVHERFWCNSYEDDMCACLDNFDIKFKLPPVPSGQTYEVRLGYQAGSERTVVQIYFDDNLTGDIPCGIPVDLRKFGDAYGWEFDADLGDEEAIEANDKAMRNQGYMKGPGSYTHPHGETTMRNNGYKQCLRRILTTKYFEEGHDYYIRLRQVLDNNAEMSLDYIEIVPKSVYNGVVAEDRY